MTISDEELAAISARAAAATPAPWQALDNGSIVYAGDPQPVRWGTYVLASIGAHGRRSRKPSDEDAAFIAAARTDVPALLAEIDRLKRKLG